MTDAQIKESNEEKDYAEDCSGEVMTEVVRYVSLELGRFKKKISELETTFDKWMYLLRNMHKLKKIPKEFDTPEFRRLFILAEIGKFTAEEMKQYLNSLKQMSDYYNIIESTAELAEKRGREEGRKGGRYIDWSGGRRKQSQKRRCDKIQGTRRVN